MEINSVSAVLTTRKEQWKYDILLIRIQVNLCLYNRESEDIMLALTDARKKANEKYIQNNYKQLKLSMPKAEAETLDEYCKAKNLTKAGFIRQAIKEKMEREP